MEYQPSPKHATSKRSMASSNNNSVASNREVTTSSSGHVRKKPKLQSKNNHHHQQHHHQPPNHQVNQQQQSISSRDESHNNRIISDRSGSNNNSSIPPVATPVPVKLRGRAPSNKPAHSRSYPRGVGLDFRKLAGLTLLGYIDHHGVHVRTEAPPSELAVAVARHFESMEVDEEQVIGGFLSRLSYPNNNNPETHKESSKNNNCGDDYTRKTSYFDGTAPSNTIRRRRRSKNAARPGEQVAAKVTRTDENGSWILASVQRFYTDTETYDVQDEDDTSKLIRLPWNHVMRLSNGDRNYTKGSHVMAIFPETTSFYRAVVSKQPIWKVTYANPNGNAHATSQPIVKELILKFEDDEDENGRTPHRRVPARYVIPLPWQYFYEEDDDVDLTTPISTVADA